MSDKKEDCFFSAMRTAFLIILGLVIFYLGYSFIYFSKISLDSKISSFFSFISSFGILFTIIVYLWQKGDNEKQKIKKIDAIKEIISKECKTIHWLVVQIQRGFQSIENENKQIIGMCLDENGYNYIDVTYRIENERYIINILNNYDDSIFAGNLLPSEMSIPKVDYARLSEMLYTAASLDLDIYNKVYEAIIIKEANHVLNGILNFNNKKSYGNTDELINYSKDTVGDLLTETKNLFFYCTGNELKDRDWSVR